MKEPEDPPDLQLIKKYFKPATLKGLDRTELLKYKKLDDQKIDIEKRIHNRKEAAPKTYVEKSAEQKKGIEKRLEDTDVALSQLIQFGGELVTNVKLANEKREILRRNFEAVKREELLADLAKESEQALDRFNEISNKWSVLKTIKEPMGLFEELEEQKKRIADLMKQKDEMIQQCQDEVKRVDERYELDQCRQSTDIYCLVERVDNQIELIKHTYNKHLELLHNTIEEERKTLALAANRKWNELYEKQTENENTKFTIQKEKSEFYNKEISRISMEQEEITRATRIRLERDAEILQLEMRNIKNNVVMNSEKLDYNYQVLQKRNVENLVVSNQQKRRVSKINEIISTLKRKIDETKVTADATIKKLTSEVLNLHSSITELETKSVQFRINNEKKYNAVWDINFQEASNSLNKVLHIDQILYEQQLGLEWVRPLVPTRRKEATATAVPKKPKTSNSKQGLGKKTKSNCTLQSGFEGTSIAEIRLLRNIMRKISDRAGFLIEEKLLQILEPYSEELKTLVRTENIFNALKINSIDDVKALTDYFLPYAWCPNCSDGLQAQDIERLYQNEFDNPEVKSLLNKTSVVDFRMSEFDVDRDTIMTSLQETISLRPDSIGEFSNDESTTVMSFMSNDMDNTITTLIGKKAESEDTGGYIKDTSSDGAKSVKFDANFRKVEKARVTGSATCKNHYLVIEPTLVLTALREYTEKQLNKYNVIDMHPKLSLPSVISRRDSISATRSNVKFDVKHFWAQFLLAFPDDKQKLWKSLEHGLNHYLIILKEREQLDTQCEFLRRQNAELKHLLKKYLPDL